MSLSQPVWAFIAIGSNLGDSQCLVSQAMDRLQGLSEKPLRRSSLWKTEPIDCPAGALPFINAVVGIEARRGETPETLLPKLQCMERSFGRTPKRALNESRPLDLDLIAFGGEIRQQSDLVLPHPRAAKRAFVLAPLSEIAPDLLLPGLERSVSTLLAEALRKQRVEKLPRQ